MVSRYWTPKMVFEWRFLYTTGQNDPYILYNKLEKISTNEETVASIHLQDVETIQNQQSFHSHFSIESRAYLFQFR